MEPLLQNHVITHLLLTFWRTKRWCYNNNNNNNNMYFINYAFSDYDPLQTPTPDPLCTTFSCSCFYRFFSWRHVSRQSWANSAAISLLVTTVRACTCTYTACACVCAGHHHPVSYRLGRSWDKVMLPIHHPAISDLRIDAAKGEGWGRGAGMEYVCVRGGEGGGGDTIGIVWNTHLHKSSILLS